MTRRDVKVFAVGAALSAAGFLWFGRGEPEPVEPARPPVLQEAEPSTEEAEMDAGLEGLVWTDAGWSRRGWGPLPARPDSGERMDGGSQPDSGDGGPGDTGRSRGVALAPASFSDSVLRRGQSLAIWGVALPHGQSLVAENAGAVLGRARFRGEVPETAPGRTPTGSVCKERWKERPTVAVNAAGNLAGVVVYLSWGMAPQKVSEPAVEVEIRDCSFTHGVLGMVEGQTLRITNKDPAEYPFRYPSRGGQGTRMLEAGQVFSIADLESGSHRVSLGFSEELYLRVVPHPYYSVSDPFGEFDLPLVPPGTYTATAWHPRLGTQEKLVSVLAGRHTEIDFEFGPGDLRR